MKKEFVGLRIDEDTKNKINEVAEERGVKISDIVREAVQTRLLAEREGQHPFVISYLNSFVELYKDKFGVDINPEVGIELALNCEIARKMAHIEVKGEPKKDDPLFVFNRQGQLLRGKKHFDYVFEYFKKKYQEGDEK